MLSLDRSSNPQKFFQDFQYSGKYAGSPLANRIAPPVAAKYHSQNNAVNISMKS